MPHIRIIGDVHNQIDSYKDLITGCDYSVQVGDMGFNYKPLMTVDVTRHKVVAGNHENYGALTDHFLGDFGIHKFPNFEFFFIRGAYSRDQRRRIKMLEYWANEELSHQVSNQAIDEYENLKPDCVISHDCPHDVLNILLGQYENRPSFTSRLLQICLNIHVPKLWVFGHHHKNFVENINGCQFICLDELAYIDIDGNGNVINDFPQVGV